MQTIYHSSSEAKQKTNKKIFGSFSCLTDGKDQGLLLFKGWLTHHASGQRAVESPVMNTSDA